MNLILLRKEFRPDGIFGTLVDDRGNLLAFTLEHAYEACDNDGEWAPKVPEGAYTCVRGIHRLTDRASPLETFEVTGVPGHTGILFHKGNWNNDSSGCILLGELVSQSDRGQMLLQSSEAFRRFKATQAGCDRFILTIGLAAAFQAQAMKQAA